MHPAVIPSILPAMVQVVNEHNHPKKYVTTGCGTKLQIYITVCILLAVFFVSVTIVHTEFLNEHQKHHLKGGSYFCGPKGFQAADDGNASEARFLSSLKLMLYGHPDNREHLETSILFNVSTAVSDSHDLILYRAILIPYDINFPGVIATRTSTHATWVIRFVAYLQGKDFVATFVQHRVSPYSERIGFQLGVRVGGEAQLALREQFWWSNCSSSREGRGLVLSIECPLPHDARSEFETVGKSSTLDATISYISEDLNGKTNPVGKFIMKFEDMPVASSRYFLAICIAPTFGAVDANRWVEYIEYHQRAVGVEHFYVYCYPEADSEIFDYYTKQGLLTRINWTNRARGDNLNKSRNYFEQGLMYNDCLARNKFSTTWLALLDVDEFIQVPPVQGVRDEESLRALLMDALQEQLHYGCIELDMP
eukprot:TRINITY_DN690_c0_g1_i1.p1 TRINITY_DN690_c0_g1~~TRINITY_DN690_c0_g1_i1.p1  ORF type:complete len:423 (+),score=0.59 TRINITY_DN690_c0_g1_i1:211-1479(+)